MHNTTLAELQAEQNFTFSAYEAARNNTGGAGGFVEAAWQDCKTATSAASDIDAKADVARRFQGVFAAFARLTMDDLTTLSLPAHTGDRARIEAMHRAILDRNPATAAWAADRDKAAAALQAKIDRTREAEVERWRQGRPAAILAALRASGHDLTLDSKGRILAVPGAPLAGVGGGLSIYPDRKAEFVAILKAEAEVAGAEAKRLAPVVVA